MKKIIFIITLSLSATFFACGDDDGSKADLSWENNTVEEVALYDIHWIRPSADKPDQTWEGKTEYGDPTGTKGITVLSAEGYAFETADTGGIPSEIILEAGRGVEYVENNIARITENADAVLVINAVGAKKKK